jgi:hypothetical protein
MSAEHTRLEEAREQKIPWKKRGQSASQTQGLSSIGSAIGNQFHGAGHVIESGNTAQTYDSSSEDQSQMVDSARSSGSRPEVVKGHKDVPHDWQKPDPIDYTHNPNLGYDRRRYVR